MLWMAAGTVQPFDRPETGLLAYSFVAGRQRNGWSIPKGGSGALPVALARYIEANGGVIQTSKPVNGLMLEGGRCVGVTTEDGSEYRAQRAVISTIHVKHLIEMAPKDLWGDAFTYGVETWDPGMSMFVAHYATTVAPEFPVDNGVVTCIAAGVATSEERMWQLLWDNRRGRVNTDDPMLLVLMPSVGDPSRAPNGIHMVKVLTNHPYNIPGGPRKWDEIKEEVAARNLAQLRRFAPNLTDDKILATAIKSPLDQERRNRHNWHGSCHGGDMGPAQSGSWRPAPGWGDHRMPIPGLYQTGATTHPGGSVTGAPGRNAAMVVLKDLGRDFSEVISARPQ
jgi:phytoene dehydrogenase-like protein